MNTAPLTSKPFDSLSRPSAANDAWSDLLAAMPIVIVYRAVRELLRQRAHRHAVLQAFRR